MSKSQKKGPAFLFKTFDMLEKQQFRQIIDWISDGSGFVVKNSNELAQKVLPKYFKHSNMHSFIRQLNMYGFNKRRSSNIQNYYYHPLFKKGQRDMIGQMQRKAQKKGVVNKQMSRQQVNGEQQQVSICVQQMSRQQNKQNKMINNESEILLSGQISNRIIGKQLTKQQQLNNLSNINIINNNNLTNHLNNRIAKKQVQQRQIKKNILQLTVCNKVLLLQQIYNLANIESTNLLCYRQKLSQQLDGQSNDYGQIQDQKNGYQKDNGYNMILQRFREVKNKYLKMHSFVWDKINSITQQIQIQQNKLNEFNNNNQGNKFNNNKNNEFNNNEFNEQNNKYNKESNNRCNNQLKQTQIQINNKYNDNNKQNYIKQTQIFINNNKYNDNNKQYDINKQNNDKQQEHIEQNVNKQNNSIIINEQLRQQN